jgi:predicted PurR-regulated permease PerM
MERSQSPDRPQRLSLLTLALITAALYFAREVLIPLALALLVSFILTPLVLRLQKMRLGRVPAVLIVVAFVVAGVAGLGWAMGRQLVDLAETLPKYEQNIRAKVASLRGGGSGALDKAKNTVEHLQQELGIASPPPPSSPAPRLSGKPRTPAAAPAAVPVTVVEPPASPITVLRTTLFPLLSPLGTAGLVIVFVIFMMIQREDLRDRFLRLLGQGRLNTSTQALDEAAQRVSRYLLMQSLVNGGTGTAVGLGLYFIGVPNAILWGLLAAVLRFIPYAGPWIAASLPILISLAVFPGWEKPLLTVGLFLLIELISNNVVEPLLYGSETGVSTIGILVAAVFWTWLWGPVGLLLATPLTVCMVVIGRYVPQFQFINVLLGDEPPLPLEAQVYHRLLAMDPVAMGAVMESSIKEKTVAEFYDTVLIPALILAERDRHRGELSPEREEFIDTTVRDWIEDLASKTIEDGSLGEETAAGVQAGRLVCVPAHDAADELAGHMFAQLAVRGDTPAVFEHDLPRGEVLSRLAELGAEQVFISSLAPFAYTQAREVCRDLRAHFPGLRIVVALWDLRAEADRFRRRLMAAGADEVVATLKEAVKAIRLSPKRDANPADLAAELGKTLRAADLTRAEELLAEAEQQLTVETLAVEVLQPVLLELGKDQSTDEPEDSAGDFLRNRLVELAEASPQGQGYRALAVSEERDEPGLLILSLLLRRVGWHVVPVGQRAPDEGLDEVIAAVQPHAVLFSATREKTAAPLLHLATDLRSEHPDLLLVFRGKGFRPQNVATLGSSALLVSSDARQALETIEQRMPAQGAGVGQAA